MFYLILEITNIKEFRFEPSRILYNENVKGTVFESVRNAQCELHRNRFYKCYFKENDIFDKVKYFNQEISNYVEPILDRRKHVSCKLISSKIRNVLIQGQNGYQLYGYGNKSWNWIFQNKSLIGTRLFWKDNRNHSNHVHVPTTQRDISRIKETFQYFDMTPEAGVTTIALSSLRSKNSTAIELKTAFPSYFDCYVSGSVRRKRNFHFQSGYVVPSICLNPCSSNISVFRTPIHLPDYALHIDHTSNVLPSCEDLTSSSSLLETYSKHALHNSDSGDIMTSLDIVTHGGIINENGEIQTLKNEVLRVFGCFRGYDAKTNLIYRYFQYFFIASPKCFEQVLTVADSISQNYYHQFIENLLNW